MKLGSDPEAFAWSPSERKVIPAYFAMGGDVDWELPYGVAYPDGAAIEFTVTPSESPQEICSHIWSNLRTIQARLAEKGLAISLLSNASVVEYIQQLPESYGTRASLQILGCNQDIRVYDDRPTPIRPDPKKYDFRTIGTHIHIELPEALTEDWKFVQVLTAALDQTLGLAYISTYGHDSNVLARMRLYGASGTIRLKNKQDDGYNAVEYRVLPSCAVLSSEAASAFYFDLAKRVSDHIQECYQEGGITECIKHLGGIDTIKITASLIDVGDYHEARRSLRMARSTVMSLVNTLNIPRYTSAYVLGGASC